ALKADMWYKTDEVRIDSLGLTLRVGHRLMTILYRRYILHKEQALELIRTNIERLIRLRGKDKVKGYFKEPVMVIMVDRSPSIFDVNNNVISVNRIIFEKASELNYDDCFIPLLFTGITHQIMRAAGETDEAMLTVEDADLYLQQYLKEKHVPYYPDDVHPQLVDATVSATRRIINLLEPMLQRRSLFVDTMKNRLTALTSPSQPEPVITLRQFFKDLWNAFKAPSAIAIRGGVEEGRYDLVKANVTGGRLQDYEGVGNENVDREIRRVLERLLEKTMTLEGVPDTVKAKVTALIGDEAKRRELAEGKNIRIVQGSDRLMHFKEGSDTVTIDISALLYDELLLMEFVHELLHMKLSSEPARAGPMEEEIDVISQEVELFLAFPPETRQKILDTLKDDNDLDDQRFHAILEKAVQEGTSAVIDDIRLYVLSNLPSTKFFNEDMLQKQLSLETIREEIGISPAYEAAVQGKAAGLKAISEQGPKAWPTFAESAKGLAGRAVRRIRSGIGQIDNITKLMLGLEAIALIGKLIGLEVGGSEGVVTAGMFGIIYFKGRRGHVPTDEYEKELFAQRWNLLRDGIERLASVIGETAEEVMVDVVDHMPAEHIQKSAVERLVSELGYIHMLLAKYVSDNNEKAMNAYVYNPADVGHTELIVVAKYRDEILDQIRSIIKTVEPDAEIASEWRAESLGVGVFVFEVSLKRDGVAVALPKEKIAEIEARLQEGGYTNVNAAALMAADGKFSAAMGKMADRIKQAVPREIPIPSVTGSDIFFLKVKRMTSMLNHNTIISEDIITENDTPRQRAAKISRQIHKIETALASALTEVSLSNDILTKITNIKTESIDRLKNEGKNIAFTFDRSIRKFARALKKDRRLEEYQVVSRIREKVARSMESYASLATDKDVEEEVRRFRRVYDAIVTAVELKKKTARTIEARNRWDTQLMFLEFEIANTEKFIRENKKKAYIRLLEIVRKNSPQVIDALAKLAAINADTSLTPTQKEAKGKMHEAVVDLNYFLSEVLRMVHSSGYGLPDNPTYIENEKADTKVAIKEIMSSLDDAGRSEVQDFIAMAEQRLDQLIVPGTTASQVFHDLAEEYIAAYPDKNPAFIKHASSLFTFNMESMHVPVYSEEEQENNLYITDIMDQTHFDRLLKKNPRLAGIGTFKIGNKASHWVITAKDMIIPGRAKSIVLIPGVAELSELKSGDTVIIDGKNKRLIINPNSNPKIVALYFGKTQRDNILKDIYRSKAAQKALTRDGYSVTMLADVPRARPDAALSSKFGSEGIGLIRLENRYMGQNEPAPGDLAQEALTAANEVNGPITFRLLDMAKDKLNDMIAIKSKVEEELSASKKEGLKGILYEGVSFYFKSNSEIGNRLAKSELKDLMVAYAKSAKKNIRISVPNVQTEEDAKEFGKLVNEVKDEIEAEKALGVTKEDLKGLKFLAMIESPVACISVEAILKTGIFSGISFGTNDLSRRSLSTEYERDDPRLARALQELMPAFLRNIRLAVSQVDSLNSQLTADQRYEVMACGEWANSVKFADYMIGLAAKYPNIKGKLALVASSYSIGELKEHIRNITAGECSELIGVDNVDNTLEGFAKEVQDRIDKVNNVDGALMAAAMKAQGQPVTYRTLLFRSILRLPVIGWIAAQLAERPHQITDILLSNLKAIVYGTEPVFPSETAEGETLVGEDIVYDPVEGTAYYVSPHRSLTTAIAPLLVNASIAAFGVVGLMHIIGLFMNGNALLAIAELPLMILPVLSILILINDLNPMDETSDLRLVIRIVKENLNGIEHTGMTTYYAAEGSLTMPPTISGKSALTQALKFKDISTWTETAAELEEIVKLDAAQAAMRIENLVYCFKTYNIRKKEYMERTEEELDAIREAMYKLIQRQDLMKENYALIRQLVKELPRTANIATLINQLDGTVADLDDRLFQNNSRFMSNLRENIHGHLSRGDKDLVEIYRRYLDGEDVNIFALEPDRKVREALTMNRKIKAGQAQGQIDTLAEEVYENVVYMEDLFNKLVPRISDIEGVKNLLEDATHSALIANEPEILAKLTSLMSALDDPAGLKKLEAIAATR
ncbi:MAG: aldolase/citrate lyase family protein, partial [Candidatus Omnitrophica bacterium]|nr:aldolase/citrate lyase family protein [Candidatus Omnitrophota bacterium]